MIGADNVWIVALCAIMGFGIVWNVLPRPKLPAAPTPADKPEPPAEPGDAAPGDPFASPALTYPPPDP